MKKLELATEIYKVKNQIKEVRGEQLIDLDLARWDIREYADKKPKFSLEIELADLHKMLEKQIRETAYQRKVEEFYATPGGIEHKAQTEEAIEQRIAEWKEYDRTAVTLIENRIQKDLGDHWGISRFDKGFLEIGVINAEKSTADRQEFYFGQTIDIRYEEKRWGVGTEVFESGCCSCGSFDVAGGGTIGERATFYIGIGQFYGNTELVTFLKESLRDSARTIETMGEELEALRKMLSHPVPETDEVE